MDGCVARWLSLSDVYPLFYFCQMENETEQELIARVYDLDGQDYE